MLLQQFLPAIRQISSEFFILQQDTAPAHRTLDGINLWAITLPNVDELFQKFFQSRLCSTFVINTGQTIHHVWITLLHHNTVSDCFCFSDMNISRGSVATRFRCGRIFYCHWKFTATSVGERIVKIDQHFAKLDAKMKCAFSGHGVYVVELRPHRFCLCSVFLFLFFIFTVVIVFYIPCKFVLSFLGFRFYGCLKCTFAW